MRIFFWKKKWGAIDRKLFDSPRSKILHFHFFQKNFENFCVTRWGLRKKNHKIFFWKMVFKSGVQSIGNFLICLDPKSCIFIFFSKNLENFCSARWGLRKKNHKIFFWKMVFKSRVQSIGNCLICLDPKSCNFTFFSRNLDSVEIHCRPYFQRKFKNSPGTFSVWYGSNKCS